jgi:hypothetical protein
MLENEHSYPVVFEEPPPPAQRGGPKSKWPGIFDELRKNPGEWAIVRRDVTPNYATLIRKGQVPGCSAGEFEARCVMVPGTNRVAELYARYVGASS